MHDFLHGYELDTDMSLLSKIKKVLVYVKWAESLCAPIIFNNVIRNVILYKEHLQFQ